MRRFDSDASSSSSPCCRKRRRSPSTSSASGSTDGSGSGLGVGVGKRSTGRSDLLLTTLSMFPGEESTCDDSYAENGKSKERIKHVLSGKVCTCSKDCRKAFTLTTIYNVCCTFWSLNKAAQDCILWGIQNMVESDGAHLVPASLALLKQNQRLPTLAAILERSMSTRGTFKAGFVDVCHY